MKKYITIAALLAAGTAFANAATPVEHDITLGDTTTTTISSGSAKIWLDGLGGAYDLNLNNGWMMDFEIDSTSLAEDTTQTIFKAQGGDGGLEISIKNNGGDCVVALTDRSGATDITTWITLEMDTVYRAAYDTLAQTVYLVNTTDTSTLVSGSWTNAGYGNMGTYAATFYTGGVVSITVGNAYDMNGITGDDFKACVVPEPSAFGLLAGLGALALVASRRRRK